MEKESSLVPRCSYVFKKGIETLGTSVHGSQVAPPQKLLFEGGIFIGINRGFLDFKGDPAKDPRGIPQTKRECFFSVPVNKADDILFD